MNTVTDTTEFYNFLLSGGLPENSAFEIVFNGLRKARDEMLMSGNFSDADYFSGAMDELTSFHFND